MICLALAGGFYNLSSLGLRKYCKHKVKITLKKIFGLVWLSLVEFPMIKDKESEVNDIGKKDSLFLLYKLYFFVFRFQYTIG